MNTSKELSTSVLGADQKERAMTVLYFGLKFLHWSLFSILFVVPLVILPIHLHRDFFSHNEIKTYEEFRNALSEARTAGEIRRVVHELRLRDGGAVYKKEREVMEGQIEFENFGFIDAGIGYLSSLVLSLNHSNKPIIFPILAPSSYFLYFLICVVNYILWGKIGFLPWRV